ncbi:MAG: hypothetical protein COW03_15250 [Cytophagales bacterium CG12_big_fil_rev_8_21_14_0_65_40_12]|nr:MAG: hypothetical protein COW03_15250 [Cytophagales bacterium CG12_big_fil_rev_8_21_14_0_65_40_12]PIW04651.1 MAG: hypothetical protein COW40_08520 [Cytophagales bacterium CG17_big_fil_post_rev_8_21_14_2_50_40_13]
MKIISTVLILLTSFNLSFQDNAKIIGDWKGALDVQGTSLPLIIHVTEKEGKLLATMDSPEQGAYGLAFDTVSFKEDVLKLSMTSINGTYEGKMKEGKFEGKWSQGGMSLDLNLEKEKK